MARKNKPNWEKISLLLKGKGASDYEINEAIKNATTNKEREEALLPLQEEYRISLQKGADKYPTIREYFGKVTADLLIRRKELINMKKININKFAKKSLEELTLEEQKQYFIYLQNQEALGELEEIDNKLSARGICFIEEGKKEAPKTEKKKAKKTEEKSHDKFEVIIPKVEDKTIQF